MEKLSAYAFPSDSDEFQPPTPPLVRLCQASCSSSRSMTAPAPPVNLASTRPSARQEWGSKRGPASQPPPQLHYKDWTTPKLLKVLFENSIPIPVGGDRMSLFFTYCEAMSAEPIIPPRLQASAVRPSPSASLSVPVPVAQDPALSAQLPLPAQAAQPQHLLPQSLTSPAPSSSAHQATFNQLQTLLQPIIDSQLALSARLDKLENPALAPPAFSSSTPAYTFDEFLPPTPPPVRLCQAFHSSSRSVTAPAPSANLASTRRSARQERGSKRGSASQPPPQLHYKDWTTPKLLKILFEKSIPIPVGGDRMSLFLTYCEALSAEPIFPPRLQASAVRPSSPATFSVPVPAAHTQDPALAAQLPLPAQSTQPQHLPQSLTPPIPSSSSAPQGTFNQVQTLLQPIIDSQLALSARLDKLENPALAPPAFSSSTPAYTFGSVTSRPIGGFTSAPSQKPQMLGTSLIFSRGAARRVITLICVFSVIGFSAPGMVAASPPVVDPFLSSVAGPFAPEMVAASPSVGDHLFYPVSVAGSSAPGMCGSVALSQ
ncbi:UNVERIFIED_CONTAM: hypothetical protein FKN15_028554 [Acipenser sinensis]